MTSRRFNPLGSRRTASSTAVDGTTVDDTAVDKTAAGDPTVGGPGADPTPGADARRPAGKGRPTPRRRDQERARGRHTGPVTAPTTRKEAKARRKSAEASMTKEERREARSRQRGEREERRRLMLEGDDRYVLSRDRGEVRRHVRDLVDSRRRLINLFMPLALAFLVVSMIPNAAMAYYGQLLFLALVLVFAADGILLGRTANRQVRERFPDSDDHGFKLGWYAVMRAMQPRILRTPKPRVSPGAEI